MRAVDLWFSALWLLLIPTSSSLALATAKSSGLFGIPAGGSTAAKTKLQAATIDASSAETPTTVSGATASSSEVCACSTVPIDIPRINLVLDAETRYIL